MTAKQYLQQAYFLDRKINSLQLQIEDLRSKATSIKSFDLSQDKVQTSIGGDRIGDLIAKIVDYERELNAKIDKYVDLKREIAEKIEEVSDDRYRLVLRNRYVNLLKWEQIALDMNYHINHIWWLHNKALQAFAKKSNG